MTKPTHPMWKRHPGLIWSNPEPGDTAFLCAALLRPRYDTLLEAALVFGVGRLESELAALLAEDTPEARRAAPITRRILRNIARGFERAPA